MSAFKRPFSRFRWLMFLFVVCFVGFVAGVVPAILVPLGPQDDRRADVVYVLAAILASLFLFIFAVMFVRWNRAHPPK